MAHQEGTLADGQVAAAWAAIYSPTTPVMVKIINFYNTGSSVETVDLGVTVDGSSRRQLRRYKLAPGESGTYERLELSAADTLDAQTTTATTVDYLVTGADDSI